jgi:cytochrome b
MKSTDNTTISVWDPIVRIGHWTLVLAFFTAYFTEDDLLTAHVWAGYVVGAVIGFRLFWGFVGSKHARFSDFVRSPKTLWQYVRNLGKRHDKRYIGHNPLGGAMIVALLLSLSVTVYTGLALYAVEENSGPLAPWFGPQTGPSSPAIRSRGGDREESLNEEDPREEFWEELHEFFANFTLLLVGLHIAGGLFSSYRYKENLVRAMITGRKRQEI